MPPIAASVPSQGSVPTQSTAGKIVDAVDTGFRIVARVLVSLLWGAAAIGGFAAGAPLIGIVAIIYLIYLWVFRGRWLIY